MNLGAFPNRHAYPPPWLSLTTRPKELQVTCSNPGHRAQAKAGPSGCPTPALPSLTFPSPPSCADRARPLPPLHQSASGAAPMAQGALVGSQLAPEPVAAPRSPPPRMKASPLLARVAQRAGRRSCAGSSGERALLARPPASAPPPSGARARWPGRGSTGGRAAAARPGGGEERDPIKGGEAAPPRSRPADRLGASLPSGPRRRRGGGARGPQPAHGGFPLGSPLAPPRPRPRAHGARAQRPLRERPGPGAPTALQLVE